ncbi:ER membrane protein complex subunit 2-like [Plodia interpunctella]|uniref:ER membrane protein complex subunit 2-like n=1 Tax=Plodia interpunctella TaxID=58824 RepID=UPI0023686B42|nr:ER membrane protein complex subunit 2-like [Plodia interpunctella]
MSDSYDDMDISEIRNCLRVWRESNERKSEEVLTIWNRYQEKFSKMPVNEKYIALEQVFYAALDCHDYNEAGFILAIFMQDFGPSSVRVFRHRIALLEAEEDYDSALTHLDSMIKMDETNAALRKRRVAIFKAQGLIVEAVKELVDYLKKFMSDAEAWQQLCTLYQQLGEYSRAAFCAEELLLHQPHNHLVHQRLADLRYTMGGAENMELAKAYYCQSLKLNPNNMRSLLGLFLVTNNLLNHYKSSGNSSKRKEIWRLSQWVQSQVSRKQRDARADNSPALTNMMLALAITE